MNELERAATALERAVRMHEAASMALRTAREHVEACQAAVLRATAQAAASRGSAARKANE